MAERWIKTLKEQCLWARSYRTVDALRQAVAGFVEFYNREWVIERLGHRTPLETYAPVACRPAAGRVIVSRSVQWTRSGSRGKHD